VKPRFGGSPTLCLIRGYVITYERYALRGGSSSTVFVFEVLSSFIWLLGYVFTCKVPHSKFCIFVRFDRYTSLLCSFLQPIVFSVSSGVIDIEHLQKINNIFDTPKYKKIRAANMKWYRLGLLRRLATNDSASSS
jgi:hypothetical protein